MTPKLTDRITVDRNLYRRPVPAQIRKDGQALFYIWPDPAKFHFIECWEAGMTSPELSAHFEVSKKVVDSMMVHLHLTHKQEQRQIMTGRQVARILGRTQSTVQRWIESGHIRSRKQREGSRVGYVTAVTPRQLRKFLSNPAHFLRYDPATITDRYWQWIALEARAAVPV